MEHDSVHCTIQGGCQTASKGQIRAKIYLQKYILQLLQSDDHNELDQVYELRGVRELMLAAVLK